MDVIYNCIKCGKEIQITAHVCDTLYTASISCISNSNNAPKDIETLLQRLEYNCNNEVITSLYPIDAKRIISYIKTGN